jgi:DNA-directed RNA polymerase subunit RPC12/RpoP
VGKDESKKMRSYICIDCGGEFGHAAIGGVLPNRCKDCKKAHLNKLNMTYYKKKCHLTNFRKKNRDRAKKYYYENREKQIECRKKWWRNPENREHARQYKRNRYQFSIKVREDHSKKAKIYNATLKAKQMNRERQRKYYADDEKRQRILQNKKENRKRIEIKTKQRSYNSWYHFCKKTGLTVKEIPKEWREVSEKLVNLNMVIEQKEKGYG